jgi:hypothetical protein
MPGQMKELIALFDSLDIEPYKKSVLRQRYVIVLENFNRRATLYSIMFYTSRITMTVGSILVPAFLSIQGNPVRDNLYFAAWIISILVTVLNGFVTIFKIDKKYYFIHMTLELLHSEGWQYIGLTGRYAAKDLAEPPSHENQFMAFFHMSEKIKMRLVEEEYWKFTDTSLAGTTGNNHPMDGMQTPQQKQVPLEQFPQEQKAIIQGWVRAMNSKSSISGLLPRRRTSISIPVVDGEQTPRRIRRTSSSVEVSVRPEVYEKASPRATVVQLPHQPMQSTTEEIFDDSSISRQGVKGM